MVRGGHQFDGRVNSPLDEKAVADAARDFLKKGIHTVAIAALFSPVRSDIETRAGQIVAEVMGPAAIFLSHTIGRVGLRAGKCHRDERESRPPVGAGGDSFRSATRLKIAAPFYISQNDGTLMNAEIVEKYPVLTFASGPTNSMRGAAYLSGLSNALVADIGGTTTDIGVLTKGFPREFANAVDIGGVRTNFRMPDVLSVGLGGGSLIRPCGDITEVGPASVGYQLTTRAHVFGGDTLTASDIAVAAGYAHFGDRGSGCSTAGTTWVKSAWIASTRYWPMASTV